MKSQLFSTQSVDIKTSLLPYFLCCCLALFGISAKAQVQFSVDVSNGCAPLTVNATNQSHTFWDTTNATFYWFDQSFNPLPTDSTYDFSFTYTNPGNYEMRLRGYDSLMAFIGEYNMNITVGGAGPFQPADSSSFCPGSSVTFSYNNMYNSLEWDYGDGSPSEFWNYTQHTYSDTGTFTVRLVVNDMCGNDTIYQTVFIDSSALPVPNPNANVMNVCVGDPVSFNAGGLQNSYDWRFDDGDSSTQENPFHAYLDTGNYTVLLTVTNICGQQGVDSISLRVDTGLFPNAWFGSAPSSCPNQLVNFSAQEPGSYVWDFGNGMTDTVQNPSTYFADTGTYVVRLILTNGCGNVDTNIQNIIVAFDSLGGMGSAQFQFAGYNMYQVDTDTVCIGDPVALRNNSWNGTQVTYKWLYGDGDSSLLQNPLPHTYSAAGNFEVQLIRSSGCGSVDTARKWVVVQTAASPDADLQWTPMSTCPGDVVLFFDNNSNDEIDNLYNYYIWYGDGDSSGILPTNNGLDFVLDTHSYANVGDYEIIFTVTNACGVTDTLRDTVFVNNPNTMPFYFNGNSSSDYGSICPGDTVEFWVATGNQVGWDYGDGSPIDSTGYHVYSATGNYYVTGFILNGCGTVDTVLDTAYIDMNNIPGGQAGVNDNFGCIGDTLWFERINSGSGDDDGPQNEQFVWAFGDGDSAFTEDAFHVYTTGGVYMVNYAITNGCGSSMSSVTLIIDEPSIDASALTITNASCGASDGEVKSLAIVSPGQVTYSWTNASQVQMGTSLNLLGVSAGVYTLTVTNQNGCTSTSGPHSVVETGAPLAPTAPSPAAYCMGDVIADLTATGTGGTLSWYADAALSTVIITGSPFASGASTDSTFYVTETVAGCESPATAVVITVNPTYLLTDPAITLCAGDSILIYGTIESLPGTYFDTLVSVNGCDSIRSTILNVNPAATVDAGPDGSSCEGSTPAPLTGTMGGSALTVTWTTTGSGSFDNPSLLAPVYSASFADVTAGSVSLIITSNDPDGVGPCAAATDTMVLTLLALDSITATETICNGDSILLGGLFQSTAGAYVDTFPGSDGCDSIVTTTLVVNPTYTTSATASICSGDSILLGGSYQLSAGSYMDTLTTLAGCDSVITTALTVNPTYATPVAASICDGDSLLLGGTYQITSGTYMDTLASVDGCDSVITTTLTVNPTFATTETAAICSGDSILLGGAFRMTAGTYMDTLSSTAGCDSILSTTLTVNPVYNMTPSTSICTGDSILLGGIFQTTAGTYTDSLTSVDGCDSTITTTLTVVTTIISSVSLAICDGDSVLAGGAYQTTAGAYVDSMIASGGCDSVVTTNLSVNLNAATTDSIAICSGDSILLGGAYQMIAGVYVDSFNTTAGCDSIVSTSLTILSTSGSSATASICIGDSILLGGFYQMSAGTYIDTFTGSNGCDSTVTTVLSIDLLPVISVSPSPGIVCTFGDTVLFTALGAATYTWSPATGLDTTGGSTVMASPGSATTYTVTGTSSAGCIDSTTVDLQLSIAAVVASFVSDTTTCVGATVAFTNTSSNALSFAWTFPGGTTADTTLQDPMVTYGTAGSYDVTLTAFGCGSDSTINLTNYILVAPGDSVNAAATICSNDSILLGGSYQNTAGVYMDILSALSGCDSIVTTTLSVDPAASAGVSASIDICASAFTYDLSSGLGGSPDGGGTWIDDDGQGTLLFGFISPALGAEGTFNFTYVVSGGGTCSDDSATVTLTIHPAPSAGNGGTLSACSLSTSLDIELGLGGTPDSGGTWMDDDTSGALTGTIFNPSIAGIGTFNFTYAVPANAGCPADAATVTVTVIGAAEAGIDGALTACAGDIATQNLSDGLGGTPDAGGSWSDDNGSGGIIFGDLWSPALVAAGTYNFTYLVTASGCPSDSAVVTITVADAPDAGSSATLLTCDSNATVDVATGLGGTPDPGGVWSDDDGTGALTGTVVDLSGLANGMYDFTYTVSSPPCADATATVTIELSTCIGIDEHQLNSIGLYPNPSEGMFVIELENSWKDAQIQVYNTTGELIAIMTAASQSKMEIDLTEHPNGLYYIKVISEDKVVTTKVSILR